jgi:hypothetical protein
MNETNWPLKKHKPIGQREKRCIACMELKPIREFYALKSWCKLCLDRNSALYKQRKQK